MLPPNIHHGKSTPLSQEAISMLRWVIIRSGLNPSIQGLLKMSGFLLTLRPYALVLTVIISTSTSLWLATKPSTTPTGYLHPRKAAEKDGLAYLKSQDNGTLTSTNRLQGLLRHSSSRLDSHDFGNGGVESVFSAP